MVIKDKEDLRGRPTYPLRECRVPTAQDVCLQ